MYPTPPDSDPLASHAGLPAPMPPQMPSHRLPTATPAGLSSAPDAQKLLLALAKRWPVAVLGGLVTGIVMGVAVYWLMPRPRYTARAVLLVASNPPRIIFHTSENNPSFQTYQRTQATLAKTRPVLAAAFRQPEVTSLRLGADQADPISWLDKELKVDFPGGAEIMTFTMTGEDSRAVTTLVNAACDGYLQLVVEEERLDRSKRYDSLKGLVEKLQGELKEKRKIYRASVEDIGVTDRSSVAIRQQSASQNLGQLRSELTQLQAEIRQLQRKAKLAAPSYDTNGPPLTESVVRDALARDGELAELKRNRTAVEARLAEAQRLSRKASDPSIRNQQDRLAGVELQIKHRTEQVRASAIEAAARSQSSQKKDERAEIQRLLEILTDQEKMLQEQVATMGTDLKASNVKAVDMNYLDDEIALASQAARTVGTEVEALNVEMSAPPRIKVIERAESPVLSDPSRRYKIGGIAGLAGFALFAGAITFLEARARRVTSPEEVSYGLGIRLIGALPARPKGRQVEKDAEAWQRMLGESVDAARTLILHASRREPMKVIMIASAVKGEGKTTLACLLSASFLRAGKRTLLIDGDLRCPAIHRLLDVPHGAGLCEILRGEATAEEAISIAEGPGMDFLPAGQVDASALRGLADGRLDGLLRVLRERYDQIIIDSPPALYVPDALMIAQNADATVMAVLRDVSQGPKVYMAHERLADLGVRMLGAIVGGSKSEESRGYAYQYSRGSLEQSELKEESRGAEAV